jgi:hypothetical protein
VDFFSVKIIELFFPIFFTEICIHCNIKLVTFYSFIKA